MMQLTRRAALLGLTSAFSSGRASLALAAAPTERRFVVVILRGALDGMSAVVPHGDRALAGTTRRAGSRRASGPRRLLWSASIAGQSPRHVPGGRASARTCGRRPHAGAQPFRSAGLPGKRCRPSHDEWLAEPSSYGHAGWSERSSRRRRIGDRCLGPAAAARSGHGGQLGAPWRRHALARTSTRRSPR